MSGKKKLLSEKQAERIRNIADDDPAKAMKELHAAVAVRVGISRAKKFSIDAIARTPKRRTPRTWTSSLDQEFSGDFDRKSLLATGRDIFLNFSFGKGILRSHVKNMIGKGPRLQLLTDDDDYNKRAEEYWMRRKNLIDIQGRSFGAGLRAAEQLEVVDGDYGLILVKGGQTQGIEGDRIANPPGKRDSKNRRFVNGVESTLDGTPLAYHIWNRGSARGQMRYAKRVAAKNFIHSFRAERFDQARGMPWIVSAVNDLQDLRETLEATKGKAKIENMLGVAIESDMPEADELASLWGGLTDYQESDADGNDEDRYEVKLGQGVHSFEMRPGEKIKTVQSVTPNNTFDSFTMLLMRIIALTLDMPIEIALQYYTRGGYSAHRAAFLQYFESTKLRRSEIEENRLDRQVGWVLRRAIKAGRLLPPKGYVPLMERESGEAEVVDPTAHEWQWPGLAILDPDKQRKGDKEGYKLGVESISDITGRDGKFWQDVAAQRIKEIKWITALAKKEGVDPNKVLPAVASPGEKPLGESIADVEEGLAVVTEDVSTLKGES